MSAEMTGCADYSDGVAEVHLGDASWVLSLLPAMSVQCCVTSPPYWGLRDYGNGEYSIGLEPTPEEWVAKLVAVFAEVRRVLRPDGTLWLNVGDAYAHGAPGGGSVLDNGRTDGRKSYGTEVVRGRNQVSTLADGAKAKDLLMLPARLALALQADGWYLRSDIIWAKPNPMPESVRDRPTSSYEHVFLLSKSPRYYYDQEAVAEPTEGRTWHDVTGSPRPNVPGQSKQDGHGRRHAGFNERYFTGPPPAKRNCRNVWTVSTQNYSEAHFAVFPEELARRCIAAGTKERDVVLDPFAGSGTTLAVAKRMNRDSIGIELQADYLPLIVRRLQSEVCQPSLPMAGS